MKHERRVWALRISSGTKSYTLRSRTMTGTLHLWKTLQKHEKTTYFRTKGSNALCIYCTASWKVGHDAVRATERKMALCQGQHAQHAEVRLSVPGVGESLWVGWARERTAQLHSGMRRKHIDFTFTTWLRAHLQEERSCCKIENLMLLQSRTVGICFCPIDIQIHCSVTGKQATRHTATVRESLQDIMISDIFCSRTNALSIPFSSFFL